MVIKIFQTNLNWVGNLCLAKIIFSLQTKAILVLENLTHFWGVTFQTKLDLVWKRTLNKM